MARARSRMYHLGGEGGLQVTEKESFQKDAGEPTISPDGRYLYYSKDVSAGGNFEYNKDPNGAIYAIVRRDLLTGEERREISVQGGAVTPRLSPDGKSLAYIRRVRLGSHLYVQDLASGESRPVFDKLDKDLQEAWAIHGLYPSYAFSPDGRAIFIWGLGKIWKVDLAKASQGGVEVPFKVRVEATLHDALRFPQKVYEDRFPVRMHPASRHFPRWEGDRLQRARPAVPEGSSRRRAAAPHRRRRHRARARDLAGRLSHRLHDLERRAPRAGPGCSRRWHGRAQPRRNAWPLHGAVLLSRRQERRLSAGARRLDSRRGLWDRPGPLHRLDGRGKPAPPSRRGEEPEVLVRWSPHLVRRAPRGQNRPCERRPRLAGSESGDRASRVRERRRDRAVTRRTVRRFRREIQGPRRAVPEDGPRGQPRSRVELRSGSRALHRGGIRSPLVVRLEEALVDPRSRAPFDFAR